MNQARLPRWIKTFRGVFDANNLTKKAFLNALASILDYSAKIVVTYIITPLMVTGLGNYDYGVWQVLLRFIGYMSPASGRPTQALKFLLAKEQNSTDFQRKRVFVGSTFEVLAIFSPLLVIPGAIISWFIPYWIKAPDASVWNIRIASGVLVLNLIAVTLSAVPQAVLEGENKGYKRMGQATLLVFLGGGLTWLALYLKAGIIGVALAALLLSIIQIIFYLSIVRSYSPWFGLARPSKDVVTDFLKLSGWFMAWNLINNLLLSSDVVVLGLLNSAESVTTYTLSKYAPETLITLIAMMVFGVLPGLSGIIGSGDIRKAAKVREEIMALAWLTSAVMGTGILLWNRTFTQLWVGQGHFVGSLANLLIVISVIQLVLIRNDANIIDLTLRLSQKVILGAISVCVSMGISAVLVVYLKMGVIGVITGAILGRLVLSVAYPKLVGQMLNISFAGQVKSAARPLVVSVILFLGSGWAERYIPSSNWRSWQGWGLFVVFGACSAVLILIVAMYLGLSRIQRELIFRRVKAVLHAAGDK